MKIHSSLSLQEEMAAQELSCSEQTCANCYANGGCVYASYGQILHPEKVLFPEGYQLTISAQQ